MQDIQSHKQAFWFTTINYVGILIGLLATLFLYPYDYDFYGEVAYIDSLAQILYPVLVFGGSQALIHFYPSLSASSKESLVGYTLKTIFRIFLVIAIVLVVASVLFAWDKKVYLFYALPLALLMAFIEVFKRQAANLQKIAIPTFYEKIIPKLALPIVFILFLYGYISNQVAFSVFIAFYFILVFLIINYVLKRFSISIFDTSSHFSEISKKSYFTYSFYSFLGSFGSFLAFRIDGLMIPEFLDFTANGAYKNAVNFAAAMAIPATGLFTIYAPQISIFIKNEDWKTLQIKYIETAKLLFFIGAVLLGCVFVGAEPFFKMLPTADKLLPILPVLYILGVNVLFNMATGFSSEIISYSSYYKFNIVAVFVLVVLNFLLNLFFLFQTNLGIVGISIATLISLVIFNVVKLIFIYKKMKILPFNKSYFILFCTMVAIVLAVCFLPKFTNNWLEIFTKVGLIVTVSIVTTYQLKALPALNFWLNKTILRKQKH
ncbi:lipopolysaccharide biosynthesis protein [Flavobacterium sp.]|uniref:lipopolysaccharide biosynthesis protein n=1 Tax=Flavobacterium sp. TaxID=239 RepID=UPI003526CF88